MATMGYIDLPLESGGGGAGVDSLNGLTGPIVLIPGPGIVITPGAGTIQIGEAPGNPNTFAGFDDTGALSSIPGWGFDSFGQASVFLNGPFPADNVNQLILSGAVNTPLTGGYEGLLVSPQLWSSMTFMSALNMDVQFQSTFSMPSGGVSLAVDTSTLDASAVAQNYNSFASFATIAGATNYTGVTLQPTISGSTGFTSMVNASPTLSSSYSNSGGIIGFIDNSQMNSGSVADNYSSASLNPTLNGTITTYFTGVNVNPQGSSAPGSGLTGVNVNFSNFSDTPYLPQALNINQGIIQQSATLDTQFITPDPVYGINNVGGTIHVASGFPINAGQFGFGNNLGVGLLAEDNITTDSSGADLGFSSVGFVTLVDIAAGKTVQTLNLMAAGSGVSGGSGSIVNASMFRALGFLPEGGTLSVTNLYGFKSDPIMSAIGATNTWGFYEGSGSENFFSKLAIGTSTKKVANSSVALEIGSISAILLARMTTTQKLALTALAGMVVYDTTLNQMSYYNGSTWVNV